ncbi:AI-2E family transporter [Streptomyces qinzhouensis]|uniref:AI-2E family transporter n=1 Tax=Streptomyces qinzhouensis TaxID=2599401 RepID=A0A5B8JFP3_9ACTN|nr:AI-2E family transporter [Streptomyces qinzhouensis]QDY80437.1 AI-2E family transporter [Streptomyces qinzhouensis]
MPRPVDPPPSVPASRPVVPEGLRVAAAYAWRVAVVAVVVYGVFSVLGRFHLLAVAVFLALVAAAVLRPSAGLLARRLPRVLAVGLTVAGSIALVLGVLALIGEVVAGQTGALSREFRSGFDRITNLLEGPPFRLPPHALADFQSQLGELFSTHRSAVVSTALSGAGRVVEVFTVFALAVFCSVFFIHSGERYWAWFCAELPSRFRGRTDTAGRAAWRTFTGYTHGVLLVALTNAVLVGIALTLLGVPLALPLALLEFFAAFVPLIGSPVALAVAVLVALATKGPLVAGIVMLLIVVIGQIEGHLLHPLVMSWAVRLHPVVVALAVIGGAVTAGVIGAVVAVPLVAVAWSVRSALRGPDRDPNSTATP